MHSVPRKLTLGLILAVGVAACGDDVTVTPPADPPGAVVRSVVVSPSSATIAQGGTFQFGASVDADAGLSNAVTWTASGGTGISVDQNGLASATATASGTASICAASTANTAVRGCAQLAVTPAAPPATVQIDAITVGCTPLNFANPGFPGVCGFNVPVAVNNVYGQIDIRGTVNRQNSSEVRAVRVEIFAVDAAGNTVGPAEYTNSETLLIDASSEESLALQFGGNNAINHSVNTADYTLLPSATAPTSAKVVHPNGQKKVRLTLLGANGQALGTSSTSERTLSFRNANGFHVIVTTNLNSGNNANSTCGSSGTAACPIRAVALAGPTAGLAYNGGTPLAITAIPVIYATGALHPNGFSGTVVQGPGTGVGFGSAACDLLPGGLGGGQRIATGTAVTVSIPAGTTGNVSGTLTYQNVTPTAAAPAPSGSVTGYQMSPVCPAALVGELPFGIGADASGNPVINFSLAGSGIYGVFNTLNSPFGPVNATFPTAPAIRLDDGGPAPIFGYATGNNDVGVTGFASPDICFGLWLNMPQFTNQGIACAAPPANLTVAGVPVNATPQAAFVFGRTARMNGWTNPVVEFSKLSQTAVQAAGLNAASAVSQSSEGLVAPSANATGLPLDPGIGAGVVGGNPTTLIARVGTFTAGGTCITVATCAALPNSAIRATAAGLTETATGSSLGAIIQSLDVFGNLTNPPAAGAPTIGTVFNFGSVACPGSILVINPTALCVNNPQDPANPYVAGGVLTIGFDATPPTVAASASGGPGPANTQVDNSIQVNAGANFFYSADDPVPAGLFGTSGILSAAPGSDLYVSLSRRDGATLQFFCPNAGNYQPAVGSCPTQLGWAAGTTTYLRGAGVIATDPAAALIDAYYAIVVFTRDQAGNQTTNAVRDAAARDFIFDRSPPGSFGANFSPSVFPANASMTFNGSATENLDVGRGAFSIRFPSLSNAPGFAGFPDFIRLPWANKPTGAVNPVGYLAEGPSTLAITLSQTWTKAMRSIEPVVLGGGAAFTTAGFTVGNANGNIGNPGTLTGVAFVQDGNLATGAGPTQYNWFAQAVSRVGLLPGTCAADPPLYPGACAEPPGITGGLGTAINYGQTGMFGIVGPNGVASVATSPAHWTQVQALGAAPLGIPNQFFNMGWALQNPTANNTAIDVNGLSVANGGITSKVYTAIALGTNGPMQSPFLGGVRFYAVDTRQPLNIDNASALTTAQAVQPAGAGIGSALVEICTATSIFNDQATNTWQYSCTFNPSTGGEASILRSHDFFGFNAANATNQHLANVQGNTTAGFTGGNNHILGLLGLNTAGFNQGWQGNPAVTAFSAAGVVTVIAVGCNLLGNCLATPPSLAANLGFQITP